VGPIFVINHSVFIFNHFLQHATNSKIAMTGVAQVWLLAVVAVLPLLYYQRVETLAVDSLVLYEACIERWPSVDAKLGYTFFILLIMYVIPILVVAVVHARIASFLRTHTANVHSVAAAAAAGGGPAADANSAANRRAQREITRNKRTTTLLSVVAVSSELECLYFIW
jgi:hypothetical protein